MKLLKLLAIVATILLATNSGYSDVLNGGFETDDTSGGDQPGATSWVSSISGTGGAFSSSQATPAFEGVNVMKIFGPFNSVPDVANVNQSLAATAGQVWEASAQIQNWAGDPLDGDSYGAVQLSFLDGGGFTIGSVFESGRITASSSTDIWNLMSVSGTAPVGTANARISLVHVQQSEADFGGSAFFDDAHLTFTAVPEPGSLSLIGFGALCLVARRRRTK